MLPDPFAVEADDPGLNRILAAGAKAGLTVNVLCWGNAPLLGGLAERNPNARIVLDHLGLRQPFEPPAPPEPFADLPKVLALAEYDNVAIKITGACTLSHRGLSVRRHLGRRSGASSTHSASSAVFGARIGPGPSRS